MSRNILFVTHQKTKCGVRDFGERIMDIIQISEENNYIEVVCNSIQELEGAIEKFEPAAIIYNYTFLTLPWITTKLFRGFYWNNIAHIKIPQIGIIHEVTQETADKAVKRKKLIFTKQNKIDNSLFDFYIAADPTLLLNNPLVFKTGRPLYKYDNKFSNPPKLIVSSFGFGAEKKGFENIIKKVQDEFDEAEIRINVPFADFIDKNGVRAKEYASKCLALVTKPGIKLVFTHDYFLKNELLDFLAKSSINIFLYEDKVGRGVSSVLDYALAVNRPVAVSDSIMFRHVRNAVPSICVKDKSLKEILNNGVTPLQRFVEEWSPENICWEYDRVVRAVLRRKEKLENINFIRSIIRFCKRFLRKTYEHVEFHKWLRSTEKLYEDDYLNVDSNYAYKEITVPEFINFNRILDNQAREIYKPTIKSLFELLPNTMAKKIPEANVNQAFVFDTVFRLIKQSKNPKILCVGSYEDTACMALIKMGYKIDEIDPMINYSLQEFVTKPTTKLQTYDIIFSTSVIEHDPDDKSFMDGVDKLLAQNGVFVMTCDFKEGWQPGDPKPSVDARLYTKDDLMNRLPSYIRNGRLIDSPNWSCSNPDFQLGDIKYTFASFVIKKDIK